ncbi:uncharacterized protein LOC127263853 [Andrographis paniculata]|uniref:uncharacterized protein LOC127263853 n=1 Tax=Andrographis paniculata TaxID=175694 RepID=UPI0021E86E47|nr:uncharacterized protein LOC127263853 [Andrographis paniculata]
MRLLSSQRYYLMIWSIWLRSQTRQLRQTAPYSCCSLPSRMLLPMSLFGARAIYCGPLLEYTKRHRSITSTWINVVVCNGNFYYMNIDGYTGEFFLVRTYGVAQPLVYKSDGISCTWKRVKHLDGATFSTSTTTSLIRDDLPDLMKNCIYFPELVDDGRHCLVYSMKLKKFYRKTQKLERSKMEFLDGAWMDIGRSEVPAMGERDDIARMNRSSLLRRGRKHLEAFGTEFVA